MNARSLLLTILVGLVLVPGAEAVPTVTQHLVELTQRGGTVGLAENITFEVAAAQDYDGKFLFYAPAGAPKPIVRVTRADGFSATLLEDRVRAEATVGGLVRYAANLSSFLPSVPAGGSYAVASSASLGAERLDLRTAYATPSLVLNLRPDAGKDAYTSSIPGGLARTDAGLHGGLVEVPAEWTYSVAFTTAAGPPGTTDFTPYVWGVAGLALGLLVLYYAGRQGWIAITPKAKRFQRAVGEPRSILEARRRTLLAALKELEHAHEAREVPDDAYAPLKEEYKAQAVRVMRSLDEKTEGGS